MGNDGIFDCHETSSYVPFISDSLTYSTKATAPPLGTIHTIETMAGHVGQIKHNGRIVYETRPYRRQFKAQEAAQAQYNARVAELFA